MIPSPLRAAIEHLKVKRDALRQAQKEVYGGVVSHAGRCAQERNAYEQAVDDVLALLADRPPLMINELPYCPECKCSLATLDAPAHQQTCSHRLADRPQQIIHESRSPDGDGQSFSETYANSEVVEGHADGLDAPAARDAAVGVGKTPLRAGEAERRCDTLRRNDVKSGEVRRGRPVDGLCIGGTEDSAPSGNHSDGVRVGRHAAGSEPADSHTSNATEGRMSHE